MSRGAWNSRAAAIGALVVGATFAGCTTAADLVSVDPSKLVRLSASASSVPADGVSTITLTATVPLGGQTEQQYVSFYSDRGSFVGATDPEEYEIEADTAGVARAQLVSFVAGTAYVRAVNNEAAASVTVEFTLVD